jgi:hypothetical protein
LHASDAILLAVAEAPAVPTDGTYLPVAEDSAGTREHQPGGGGHESRLPGSERLGNEAQSYDSSRRLRRTAEGRMGAFTVPFSTRVAASLVDLANVAATKRSFDVARPIAFVVRAIANDPSGEVQRTFWPR